MSRKTYRRRRISVFGALGLALVTAFYLPMTLLAPLEQINPSLVTVAAPANPAAELAWPASGSSAIGAVGFAGVLAHSSDTSVRSIASITKVITSLVVLQAKPLKVDEPGPIITMTQQDVDEYRRQIANNGSTEPVASGVELTQRQLMEVVLIASANNYAESMARWAFGSEDAFLGAARTWLDAHGLTGILLFDATGLDPRNTSTAADLVELGKLALTNPVISAIVSTQTVSLPFVGTIDNTNKLLGWNGVDGIKTGTVENDNVCLLFATTITVGSKTIDLIGVVLGSTSHDELDAAVRELLTTAVQGFRDVPLVTAGEVFASYKSEWDDRSQAVAQNTSSVVVWGGIPVTVSVRANPLTTGDKGRKVGTITYTIDGVKTNIALTLDHPIEDPGPWWRLSHPFG